MLVREPAVAGYFYPANPEALRAEIKKHLIPDAEKIEALAIIVPHAGYMYSGHVAGATYSSITLSKNYVILCPNHTGYGASVAINAEGGWRTPLGIAPINSKLAKAITARSRLFEEDSWAHRYEHSLEVQLPFLQYLAEDFSFVPINVGTSNRGHLREIGCAVAEAVREYPERALIVASSDMTHYESAESARKKDELAIAQILKLDPDGLYDTVKRFKISMCGYAPSVSVLEAARLLGAKQAKLIRYANSGDITGDHSSVVGYAGLVLF